mgnify:CR=1 FL=1
MQLHAAKRLLYLVLSFFLSHQNFNKFMIVSYMEVGFFLNKMTYIEKNIWIKTQTIKENNNVYQSLIYSIFIFRLHTN